MLVEVDIESRAPMLPFDGMDTLVGLIDVDGPEGETDEDSVTVPENPPRLVRVTLTVADDPAAKSK